MVDVQQIVQKSIDRYGNQREALLSVLQSIVSEKNFLDDEDMYLVARELNLSAAEVYGTASFYTFLDVQPRGKYVIRLCKTISCHMAGKDEIIATIEDFLKIKVGDTTKDMKFTLLTANCLGWCHKGPVMLINDDVYPELNPQKTIEILVDYKRRS